MGVRALRAAASWVLCSGLLLGGWVGISTTTAEEPDAETRAGWAKLAELGEGFVVWESSRSGHWRLWRRDLDGSGLRRSVPTSKAANTTARIFRPMARAWST